MSAAKAAQAVVAIGTDARMKVKSEAVPVVMLMLVMIATMAYEHEEFASR